MVVILLSKLIVPYTRRNKKKILRMFSPFLRLACSFSVPFVFSEKRKRPERLILQAFQSFIEQGMRESNSRQRFWRPLSYHLTNPLYIKYYEGSFTLIYYIHLSFVFQVFSFVPSKLHTDLQTPRKFDSLCSSNDQTTNLSLLSKNGHLDSASLHLDEFAPQTSVPHSPDSSLSKLTRCLLVPYFHFSPLLVKPSTD